MSNWCLPFFLILPLQLLAHSGGLDSYGCHNETATGMYHCHEGNYPGMSFYSKEEAVTFFAFLQDQNNSQSIIINTSVGLYQVTTVTGTLNDFHDTIRNQVWITGDYRSYDLAHEFANTIGSQLGLLNSYPVSNTDFQGPFFVNCTYIDESCSAGFNASFWSPLVSSVLGVGTGGGANDQRSFIFAVANALPTVTIVDGDRVIPDTDDQPGEQVSFEFRASDHDGIIAELSNYVENLSGNQPSFSFTSSSSSGQSSTTVYSVRFIRDGENLVNLWAIDDEGAINRTTALITVEPPEYDRDSYLPEWADIDEDCINTRHEVLILESQIPVTMSPDGCFVEAGLWDDPYTGLMFTNPSDVDIDHFVPLSEAHQSGAAYWSNEKKQAFANDILNRNALIAVDDGTNSSKGSRDPAEWLPPNADYHCEYVRNWVEIKNIYELTFDNAELEAIEQVLGDDLDSATGVTQNGIYLDGTESSARFSLGMNKNGGCPYYTEGSTEDLLTVSMTITPEEQHLGLETDIFIVAQIGAQLHTLTPEGQLIPIDVDLNQLVAFRSAILNESLELTLFDGYLGDPIYADIFTAYWPKDGQLIYTPMPASLLIE